MVVPWQGSVRIGLVVGSEELPAGQASEYREVVAWLDREPFLIEGAAELLLELAEDNCAPAGVVLASLAPVGLREQLVHEVRVVEGVQSLALPPAEWLSADSLGPSELDLYRRQGLIHERVRPLQRTVNRLVPERQPDEALSNRPQANQRLALERLEEQGSASSAAELARDADVPESAVRALVRKGYAAYRQLPAPPEALNAPVPMEPALEPLGTTLPALPVVVVSGGLRRDRLAAVLPSLQADLAAGKSALVLAPEAAYQAEAARLLASRLPVLALTGESSDEQRLRVWEECASGRPLVLVATYTGLLAPFGKLGRIVVTEAGSASYKLMAGPRLFVPGAARLLAQRVGVPLVLSDVLPSPEMELWSSFTVSALPGPDTSSPASATTPANDQEPSAGELALPQPRQRFYVSDLARTTGWPIGSELAQVLRQVRDRGRQAILLAPRRGFSGALACQECGLVVMCPNCDLSLRYHRASDRLRCHQCGHSTTPPDVCSNCGGSTFSPGRAAGVEWVADSVTRLLPELPVARFDRDRRDDISALMEGSPGVLVATSALFRLPPLPRVSLLAVTLLDAHLSVSDFRAAEEGLRMLLQLPELASGARPLVLIQTFQPEHEALTALASEEPETAVAEYRQRVNERRKLFHYPPFGKLAKLQVSGRDRGSAEREAARLAASLVTAGAKPDEVLGPVPAPITRIRGQFSFLVYLRGREEASFSRLLKSVSAGGGAVKVRLDVDPRDVAEFLE